MADDKPITQDGPRGFTISDRRSASDTGSETHADAQAAEDAEAAEQRERERGVEQLPQIDFSTLLLSLSTSVMVHLGEAPTPDGGVSTDLAMAKQTIDIIEMLQQKTAGNLDDDESELLRQLLHDLRLRYVKAVR
jgi:hypothetical protein